MKKPLRGVVRTQRCRWSKSPILDPPRFVHCSSKATTCSQLISKESADVSESCSDLDVPISKGFATTEPASHALSDVDGKQTSNEPSGKSTVDLPKSKPENGPTGVTLPTTVLKATDLSDLESVSEQIKGSLCARVNKACQCKRWQNMKVCMFSELQNSSQLAHERAANVEDNSQPFPSRTPCSYIMSCSEQARAYVDDVSMEDLSGYMECFLFIPKKMSHMAEMMYT